MFFSRSSTGIAITPGMVTCVSASGAAVSPRIDKVAAASLPANTLRISLREPNVLEPERFVDRLRSAHNLLLSRTAKVSVSLPDAVGRIMLLDVEGRFKSRTEALDLIRWKLKKSIPFDIEDTHLDYQQLKVRENGDMALLVALVSRTVITQYEELIGNAGLIPHRIDFNSFNLCRTFDQRLSLTEEAILIFLYEGSLGVMAFSDGVVEFCRMKDLSGINSLDSRLFMEINSSLLVYKERFPERVSQAVFCAAPPDIAGNFCEMVSEAAGSSAILLETKSAVVPGDSAPADQETLYPYTAAIGAALRSL